MYFYSHKFCYQDHLREKKSIFVSFPGNWFWHFHPYEKILMEDFVHSWTTGWCRVDSKVLEKINEVAKVLWGRIYFLIGMGWEGGEVCWFQWVHQGYRKWPTESSRVIRLELDWWSWYFATTGRDDEEQKAWDQTASVCVLALPGQCPCSLSLEQSIQPQLG